MELFAVSFESVELSVDDSRATPYWSLTFENW
jgi:hypothetical protein